MPSSRNPKKIILRGDPIRKEAPVGASVIPGMLVAFDPVLEELIPHGVAGGNAAPAFAVEQDFLGKTIDDPYVVGPGGHDRAQYVISRQGDEIYAFLAPGENVAKGAFLESDGLGALQEHTPLAADGAGALPANQVVYVRPIVARAIEAVDNALGIVPVRIRAEVV